MRAAPPGWPRDADAEPEALIKEARRRQRRRYLGAGLAIVVALAAAAGVTAGLTGPGSHSPGRQGPRRLVSPPAEGTLPRFFADTVTTGEGNGPLQVRASADGRLVAEEQAHIPVGVTGLAATGAGSFVLAEPGAGRCGTRLDRVQLSGQGRPGGLAPVGPELRGQVWSLAAGAGGQVIGYAVSGCGKGDPGYLGVFDARTRRSRQWGDVSLGGVSPGNVALSGALSMSANGRLLAFTGWEVAGSGWYTSQVVRVLPTDAPVGTVAQRSRVVLSRPVSQPELAAASLSPSGAFFYLCTQAGSGAGRITRVAGYRTTTGKPQHILAALHSAPAEAGCPMALDTSGRFLLVPYSLNPVGRPQLKVARINLATRAVTILNIRLPVTAGMDPATGMNIAW